MSFIDLFKTSQDLVKGFLHGIYNTINSCRENNIALQNQMKELQIKKEDIERQIDKADREEGKKKSQAVKWWLENVRKLEEEADDINRKVEKSFNFTCVGDVPADVFTAYQLSKSACDKLKQAEGWYKKSIDIQISEESGPDKITERFEGSIIGMDSEFNQLKRYVNDDTVKIIGVYGMGGVGKTSLLEKFCIDMFKDVDDVIIIDMSNHPSIEDVQKAIATQRQLKSNNIFKYLKKRKFVLILDNLWKEIDLKKIGIPTSKDSKGKVILTTRIVEVCDLMGAKKVEVKCLKWEDAWNLFIDKLGNNLDSKPKIKKLAEAMVKKCGGLPLALKTIGETMASKEDPAQWTLALNSLSVAPWKIPGMETKVLSVLKTSYDNLAEEAFRTCFLYCSLYPQGTPIFKDRIIDYYIAERITDDDDEDDNNDMKMEYNMGREIIGIIKASSLLMDVVDYNHMNMHPMVYAMALWIAYEKGKKERKWLLHAGTELKEAPHIEKWSEAKRISLMGNQINKLSNTPYCPSLLTLVLRENYRLKTISDGFFKYMPILKVLDLSYTSIEEVPSTIGALVELQYLNLSGTKIKTVPKELGVLKNLRSLNFSFTQHLKIIPEELLPNLSRLQVFYMQCGYGNWKVGSTGSGVELKELRRLNNLQMLGITIETAFAMIDLGRPNHLAESLCNLHVRDCPGQTTISFSALSSKHKALEWLQISDSHDLEEVVISGEKSILPNLKMLTLLRLNNAKIIYGGGKFESLCTLLIRNCNAIEQLIACDEENLDGEGALKTVDVFPNLITMQLDCLPNLENLCGRRRALNMPSLEIIRVKACPKLKSLALIADNLKYIQGQMVWWNELEWEDDNNKMKFLPLFKESWNMV